MFKSKGERGQAAVETALVMPLMVFLVLGILQLGLITQARVMAKYAAYRAARVGAMNHANVDAMRNAALLHLLPVLVSSDEVIMPTGSPGEVISKMAVMSLQNATTAVPGARQVDVVICGPIRTELEGGGTHPIGRADQQQMHSYGSRNEVDFDDPALMINNGDSHRRAMGIRKFNRTRLRIQVQLLYRMPIPFANWVMTHLYLGTQLPRELMLGKDRNNFASGNRGAGSSQVNKVRAAAFMGVYTLPINVTYAMRMQSNFFLQRYRLPQRNECVHYTP